jgi:predicted nuclease of predicted toxin-antitoxin system
VSDRVSYLLDENVELAVAIGLRREGVDVLSVVEIGRAGLDDQSQMAFALAEQRVIVTYDDDYLALSASGSAHCGIAFARRPSTQSAR